MYFGNGPYTFVLITCIILVVSLAHQLGYNDETQYAQTKFYGVCLHQILQADWSVRGPIFH